MKKNCGADVFQSRQSGKLTALHPFLDTSVTEFRFEILGSRRQLQNRSGDR
jgi:hypothetical protein